MANKYDRNPFAEEEEVNPFAVSFLHFRLTFFVGLIIDLWEILMGSFHWLNQKRFSLSKIDFGIKYRIIIVGVFRLHRTQDSRLCLQSLLVSIMVEPLTFLSTMTDPLHRLVGLFEIWGAALIYFFFYVGIISYNKALLGKF